MDIKAGYKLTEVGVIPNDWAIKAFGEVLDGFSSGQTPYRAIKNYYTGNIPWITSGELNYNIITDTVEKITQEAVRNTNLKTIPKGTFLFAITGLEAEGTRGSCAITGIDATTNQSCMALYPKKGKLTTLYLFHYYVRYGKALALQFCQGTKQQSYTGGIAKKLPIILPPTIEEQTAIATALSDADQYIAHLEKLIAKKRLVKQGAMQELLRPKEGWVVKKLYQIGKTYGGLSGKTKIDFQNGEYPYIPFMNIMSNTIIDTDYFDYVKVNSFEHQNTALNGDLFFNGSSETPEEVGMCSVLLKDVTNLYLNSFCFGFRLLNKQEISGLFLSYFFRSKEGRKLVFSLAQGATRYNLSKANFLKLEVPFPNFAEQNRIANIFKDFDMEITVLETKLSKAQSIKQGMMQQLLTGKIRLV